jgi:hypothetical protein
MRFCSTRELPLLYVAIISRQRLRLKCLDLFKTHLLKMYGNLRRLSAPDRRSYLSILRRAQPLDHKIELANVAGKAVFAANVREPSHRNH